MGKRKRKKSEQPARVRAPAPCLRCIDAWKRLVIPREAIMPLDGDDAMNPIARAGWTGHVCHDCASAETLIAFGAPGFDAARSTVASARCEEMRLPGVSGLGGRGIIRPCARDFDLADHLAWLVSVGVIN